MSDIAISAVGLGKAYRISHEGGKRYKTLQEDILQWIRHPFPKNAERAETFWALKDISFEIKRGEVVGVIGRNGAGKSTLLKILSRITRPSTGYADVYGRVGALLEVGTGFHPELTGRENIYLSGAVLGMTRREIEGKFDEIVDFAEIEQFLDTPAKRYSSKIYMRLAFAVAAHLEPEILVVDEVLAVGDAKFQEKSLGKMGEVARGGRTVLFVSHNMAAINRLCHRVLLFEAGQITQDGTPRDVIADYLTNSIKAQDRKVWPEGVSNSGVDEFKLISVRLLTDNGDSTTVIDTNMGLNIEIHYRIVKTLPYCRIGFLISTSDGVLVSEGYDSDDMLYTGPLEPGDYITLGHIPAQLLNVGEYLISLNAGIPNLKNLVYLDGVLRFSIEETSKLDAFLPSEQRPGVIYPRFSWKRVSYSPVSNTVTSKPEL